MIIDDLYMAIVARLLDQSKPSLGIATIDWENGQAAEWEKGITGKADPLKLPAVLVKYDEPNWKARGRKLYQAEGRIYLQVVQRMVDEPFASDRRAEKITARRNTYTVLHSIGKRMVGMRGVGYSTFGMIGMEQDHDYKKLRVDVIAFRSLLSTNIDPAEYSNIPVPDLVINTDAPMPVPTGRVLRILNTDESYEQYQLAPGTFYLSDLYHTDSNGQQVLWPGMKPFVCTPAGGGGSCPVNVRVYVNGDLRDTLNGLNPCENQTININLNA